MKRLILLACITLFGAAHAAEQPAINHGSIAKPLSQPLIPSLSPIVKRIEPGVVNIQAEGKVDVPTLSLKRDGGDSPTIAPGAPVKRDFEKLGSGVIIDPIKGYIITNAHVVKDTDKITVHFSDGSNTFAKLIGMDAQSDIAVLQVSGQQKLTALPIANSDQVKVGDFVAALGSPFGLTKTVTFGIVSALGRNDLRIEGFENFIQTDAAINPGNSGGALVDMRGQLIGINTAILAPSGGNIGIGFAIPIDMARSIMNQIVKYGEVRRGVLGLYAQPLTRELAAAMGIKYIKGVVVTAVNPDSPAEKAKLNVGDIVTEVNGKTISDPYQLRNVLGLLRVNSPVRLKVIRKGKVIYLNTQLTAAKSQQEAAQKNNPFLTGVRMAMVEQNTKSNEAGQTIQVVNVPTDSPAWLAGLRPGDIIISANMITVHSIAQLNNAAKHYKDRLLLNIMRGDGAMFIVIK
jgi:Do/DeqQ family serine protease